MNDIKAFVQTLAEQNTTKLSMNAFFKTVHDKFYFYVDISFMEYFLDLTAHENEFVVPHSKLFEYGIMTSKQSSDVKIKLDALGLIKGDDYTLRDISERGKSGSQIHKHYHLTPEAFKKCLMRTRKGLRPAKLTQTKPLIQLFTATTICIQKNFLRHMCLKK